MVSATPSLDELPVLRNKYDPREFPLRRVQLPDHKPESSQTILSGYLLGTWKGSFVLADIVWDVKGKVTPTSNDSVYHVPLNDVEIPVYWEPEETLPIKSLRVFSDPSNFIHTLKEFYEIRKNDGTMRLVYPHGICRGYLYYVSHSIRYWGDIPKEDRRVVARAHEDSLERRMPLGHIVEITKLKRIREPYLA